MSTNTYYDGIAAGYDALHGGEQRRKARAILSHLSLSARPRILDVGGGTGVATAVFPGEHTILDPSAGLLAQSHGEKIRGTAERLPFPDASFECVISITALHHFHDPARALSEMKRASSRYVAVTLLKKARRYAVLDALIRAQLPGCLVDGSDPHDVIYVYEKRGMP